MSTGQLEEKTEFRRKDLGQRHKEPFPLPSDGIIEIEGVRYKVMPFSETEEIRNKGFSIYRELRQNGWFKPEREDLLDESDDGLSFNLLIEESKLLAMSARKDKLAQALGGNKPSFVDKIEKTVEESEFARVPTDDNG